MSQPANRLLSSVARKLIMGVTGLMLIGFIVVHMVGNLQIFMGKAAFDAYAENLHKVPGFPVIELGLLAIFVVHIATAISLVLDNRKARPVQYEQRVEQVTWASRMMAASGILVLFFLVVHMKTLRFGEVDRVGAFQATVDVLKNPLFSLIYLVGVILMMPHLRHGIHSCFRSLGLTHEGHLKKLEQAASAIALLVTVGFASIPVWVLVTK